MELEPMFADKITLRANKKTIITEDIAREFMARIVWDGMTDQMRETCCDIVWGVLLKHAERNRVPFSKGAKP